MQQLAKEKCICFLFLCSGPTPTPDTLPDFFFSPSAALIMQITAEPQLSVFTQLHLVAASCLSGAMSIRERPPVKGAALFLEFCNCLFRLMAEESFTMKGRTTGMARTKQDPLTPPTPWGKLNVIHLAAFIFVYSQRARR